MSSGRKPSSTAPLNVHRDKEWSNTRLISAVLNGQREAFELLVEQYGPELTAYCWSLLGRHDAVADAVQETFFRGYIRLKTLEEPTLFRAWLKGIAFRVCQEWNRSFKHASSQRSTHLITGVDMQELAVAPEQNPKEDIEREGRYETLLVAVDKLSSKYRDVILLHYLQNLSHEAIAEQLKLSEEGVKTRLKRARLMLRKRMKATDANGAAP